MSTVNVADKAIAQVALASVTAGHLDKYPELEDPEGLSEAMAAFLLDKASKVRFQPSTRQLVLTFDLAFNSNEPDTSGPVQ